MTYDNPDFFSKIDIPLSLQKLVGKYGTKISVSKVVQGGIYGGYCYVEDWLVSVYIITDICRVCGEAIVVGRTVKKEKCSRHSWDRAIAILLFDTVDTNLQSAFEKAGKEADRFLASPEKWVDWKVEKFLTPNEYINK